jgi:hypothetical protein
VETWNILGFAPVFRAGNMIFGYNSILTVVFP